MKKKIKNIIESSIETKKIILEDKRLIEKIVLVTDLIVKTFKTKNKILFAGNGGSAADSQHIAAEFVGRFYKERKALPAIALTTDTSILTALGNDYHFNEVFKRQVEALGVKNDILFCISTSGNSKNIIMALHKAKELGITTIGLTGESGGEMKNLCDFCLCVPSSDTARIQESHLMIEHIICFLVEEKFFH